SRLTPPPFSVFNATIGFNSIKSGWTTDRTEILLPSCSVSKGKYIHFSRPKKLILLWIAEGFREKVRNKSLKDVTLSDSDAAASVLNS
ncbi:Hypothetical predicted protein, partial [Olea europaea subsp. europaea]